MSYSSALEGIEAERNLLGCMLLDEEAYFTATEVLGKDDFSEESHRQLFQAIDYCQKHSLPLDMVALRDVLLKQGRREPDAMIEYMLQLMDGVASSERVSLYAKIVEEKSRLRKLRHFAQEILQMTSDETKESAKVMEEAEKKIFSIAQAKTSSVDTIGEVAQEVYEFYKQHEGKKGLLGIPSGYLDLDHLTSGFQPSDLIIIAGRTSMGKTSFALNIAEHVAIQAKIPVGIFSLEMAKEQLALRLLCSLGRVSSADMRQGDIDYNATTRLADALRDLSDAPIYIDDGTSTNIVKLRSKARRLRREKKMGLLIVDYLQLMIPEQRYDNRALEIAEISRSLKTLARELNIPVIALSQLSRAADKDKMPQLSHLRESGSIEQDADLVLFVHRPYFWEQLSMSKFEQGTEEAKAKSREARIIIAKHRNGPTGTVELVFDEVYTHFVSKEKYLNE